MLLYTCNDPVLMRRRSIYQGLAIVLSVAFFGLIAMTIAI